MALEGMSKSREKIRKRNLQNDKVQRRAVKKVRKRENGIE
jgi:hypothetical protein